MEQGIERGMKRGMEQGIQQGERSLLLRLPNRRLGMVSSELISQIDALPLSKLEDLREALLDFREEADLSSWFQSHLCEAKRKQPPLASRPRRPVIMHYCTANVWYYCHYFSYLKILWWCDNALCDIIEL